MPDSVPAIADSNPAVRSKRPCSVRNGVRHLTGMVSVMIPESCPAWTGARIEVDLDGEDMIFALYELPPATPRVR